MVVNSKKKQKLQVKENQEREELITGVFQQTLIKNLNELVQSQILHSEMVAEEEPILEQAPDLNVEVAQPQEEKPEPEKTEDNGSGLTDKDPRIEEKKVKPPRFKQIVREYWDLLDFPGLFKFILHQLNKLQMQAKLRLISFWQWNRNYLRNTSTGITPKFNYVTEKLFYSDNFSPKKVNLPKFKIDISFLSSKKMMRDLAIACLIISFLSFVGAIVPITVAKINSIKIQSQIQKQAEEDQRKRAENEAMLKQYEVDPNKEQSIPKEFKLSIPKIGLDSDISPSVNLDSEEDYKRQLLSTGVAHAKGSYFPGQSGSVFLFAHSTDSVFNIAQFNAKFFSLGELQNGDEIKVFYQGREHIYKVVSKVIVEPEEIDLIRNAGNSLILMTCTPPGTDWQRLIIFADEQHTTASTP